MKKFLAVMLTVMLAVSFSSVAFGAQIQQSTIYKVDNAPVIDGQIDALWADAAVHKMENYIVAEKDNKDLDPKKSADDFSGQWRAVYDDKNIYVLVEITDDVRIGYNFVRDGGTHQRDDSVNILVGEGASHSNVNFHIDTLTTFGVWTNEPDWKTLDHEQLNFVINDHGDGYIVEVAIPWTLAGINGVTPADGKTINFDVQAVDNDLGPEKNEIGVEGRYPQSKLTWNDLENKGFEDSGYLGKVTLAGTAASDSDASSTDGGAAAPSTPSTPNMPKTGMGGTDGSSAPWIVALAAIVVILFVGIRKFRAQN